MRCFHCAEEIQDQATVCRHCDRPVPTGMEKIDQRGERYMIGSAGESYRIWEIATGGSAVATFPRTEDGGQGMEQAPRA